MLISNLRPLQKTHHTENLWPLHLALHAVMPANGIWISRALKANITALEPRVLPLSEQLRIAANAVAWRCLDMQLASHVPGFSCALHAFLRM